jgi:YHS domain-containing protein
MDILPGKKLTRVDPVCGLEVRPTKSNPFEVVKGHTYYFCTEKCRRTFNNEPLKYIDMLNFLNLDKKWWERYLRD